MRVKIVVKKCKAAIPYQRMMLVDADTGKEIDGVCEMKVEYPHLARSVTTVIFKGLDIEVKES